MVMITFQNSVVCGHWLPQGAVRTKRTASMLYIISYTCVALCVRLMHLLDYDTLSDPVEGP